MEPMYVLFLQLFQLKRNVWLKSRVTEVASVWFCVHQLVYTD